jgi:hypothetical protein
MPASHTRQVVAAASLEMKPAAHDCNRRQGNTDEPWLGGGLRSRDERQGDGRRRRGRGTLHLSVLVSGCANPGAQATHADALEDVSFSLSGAK